MSTVDTESITYAGSVDSLHRVATWVMERGGSCTSPMAVEFGMEDAFRVVTVHGARDLTPDKRLDFQNGHFYVIDGVTR